MVKVDGNEEYGEIISRNHHNHYAYMDRVRRRFEKALYYDKERAQYALGG